MGFNPDFCHSQKSLVIAVLSFFTISMISDVLLKSNCSSFFLATTWTNSNSIPFIPLVLDNSTEKFSN
ncbi:hypothetical protein ACB092_02G021800 [Castanea dentata]